MFWTIVGCLFLFLLGVCAGLVYGVACYGGKLAVRKMLRYAWTGR